MHFVLCAMSIRSKLNGKDTIPYAQTELFRLPGGNNSCDYKWMGELACLGMSCSAISPHSIISTLKWHPLPVFCLFVLDYEACGISKGHCLVCSREN